MWRALAFAAVEQRGIGQPGLHARQFVAEIRGVPDARAHPLPEEGRRLLRGVGG
jgi:hypothetical protein